MTESNRLRLSSVPETTLGVTPTTPRMRTGRITGESLQYVPAYIRSEELRADRMNADPIKVNESNTGGINCELSFPVWASPMADWLESLMCNAWVDTPFRDNDGTPDSVITDLAAATGVITVTTGAAFVVGHLVRLTGFTLPANNLLARITTGSATVPAVGAGVLTDDAVPAAAARVKVVGIQGVAGDLVAVADGITSTALNFTTFAGLTVGKWIKIGGTGAGFRFATEACNEYARIIAVTATKLTLDNLPTGWTTDAGATKTLRIFYGDQIRNGITTKSVSIERGFMGQGVPTYILQKGMVAGQGAIELNAGEIAKINFTFTGMTGSQGAVSADDTPDAATTNPVMAAAVNVGRISENGIAVVGPNFIRSMNISVNNNLRALEAIRSDGLVGPVGINTGENAIDVNLSTYFGSNTLYGKLISGAATNATARITKDNQTVIWAVPRLTLTGGPPSAAGKNQDVMLDLTAMASIDTLTNAQVLLDRMEYVEA